jgi:hypothetical protein
MKNEKTANTELLWEAPKLIIECIDMTEVPKDPTDTEALDGQVS